MYIHEGVAEFGGASTRPAFRQRGVQTALLHARMDAAREAGCDLALVVTAPGEDSQRNVERAGFRLAYTKVVVVGLSTDPTLTLPRASCRGGKHAPVSPRERRPKVGGMRGRDRWKDDRGASG